LHHLTVPCSLLNSNAPKSFIRWHFATRKAICVLKCLARHKKRPLGSCPAAFWNVSKGTQEQQTQINTTTLDPPAQPFRPTWLALPYH
jgi:hypothetical protein